MDTVSQFCDRNVRPDYFGPACNHARRVDVGIRALPAGETHEVVAGLSVGLLDVAAGSAFARCVARIDVADGKSGTLALVGDLGLQITEGPRVEDSSLLPRGPYPTADTIEVFDGDSTVGAVGHSDDLLRDTMVRVAREALFLQLTLPQEPPGALGSLLLELLAKPCSSSPKVVKVRAREVFAVAGCSDVDDSDVHAEPTADLALFGVGHVNRNEQVEAAIPKSEIRLSSVVLEKFTLMFSADERDALAPFNCPDVGCLVLPGQDARIVRYRSERPEDTLPLSVELVGVSDLRDASNDYLGREVFERSAAVVVGESVKVELAEGLGQPTLLREPVTCCIRSAQSVRKRDRLLGVRPELDLDRELHTTNIAHSRLESRIRQGFLPVLKGVVSAQEIR